MANRRDYPVFFDLDPTTRAFRQSMFYQDDRRCWRCRIRITISVESDGSLVTIGYYRYRREYERFLAAIDSVELDLSSRLLEALRIIKNKCTQITASYHRVLYAYHPGLIDKDRDEWTYVNTLVVDRHGNIETKHEMEDDVEPDYASVLSDTLEMDSLRAENSLCDRLRLEIHALLRTIGVEFLEKLRPGVVCSYACLCTRD